MSADEEYTAYVGTRWVGLVRAAVLLGCPRHQAEDLVRSVLVRGYRDWEAAWRADLTDVHVVGLLLSAVHDQAAQPATPSCGELSDIAYAVDRDAHTDLAGALALLGDQAREALVMRYVTELTPEQTARVLGIPTPTLEHLLVDALGAIDADTVEHEPMPCGDEAP